MRFSASSYKEYLQCGLRFKYRKIDKIPSPDGEATHHRWFGKLVHEIVYAGLGTKTDSKTYTLYENGPRVDYAVSLIDGIWDGIPADDVARSILEDIGPKPEVFSPGKIKALRGDNIAEGWREQGKSMVSKTIPALSGLHRDIVELELVGEWDFLGKAFIGYLDIVVDQGGKLSFYDLKTSWHKPGKKLQDDFQFFIYSHALKQTRGLDYYPKGNWVHAKDGSILPFEVTPETVAKHTAEAEKVFDYIHKGVFPSIYGSPLCKFCDYFTLCYGEDGNKDAF